MSKNDKKRDKSLIFYGIIALIAVSIFLYTKINNVMAEKLDSKMRTVDLFAVNVNAGDKYIAYHQKKYDYNDTYRDDYYNYEKAVYVSPELRAKEPDEVGYIISISYAHTLYGKYSDGTNAYICDTYVNIYDCHTGLYLSGDDILINGGNPPNKKGNTCNGSTATEQEITEAVNRILND